MKLKTLNRISKTIVVLCPFLLLPVFINTGIQIFGIELEKLCTYTLVSFAISVLILTLLIKSNLLKIIYNGNVIKLEDIPYFLKQLKLEGRILHNDVDKGERTMWPPKFIRYVIGGALICSGVIFIACVLIFYVFGDIKPEINPFWLLIICICSLVSAVTGFVVIKKS